MTKLGITGLIGSGKTSVTNIIKSTGVPTFCADKAVKDIYLKDKKFIKKLYKLAPSLNKIKSLKKNASKKIYKNKNFLKNLEKLIHPLVKKKMNSFINKNKNKKLIALDIPLLIENKIYKNVDRVLLIKCNKKNRIKRFLVSGKNIKFFKFMEKKQLKYEYKKRFADNIIDNSGSLINTRKSVLKLIKKIKENARSHT